MGKWNRIFVVLLAVLMLFGCQKKESKDVELSSVMEAISKEMDFKQPETLDLKNDKAAAERYGVSVDDIKQGFTYTSSTKEQSADEIIIIEAIDEDKIGQLQSAMEAEVTGLAGTWESTSKEEYDKIQQHKLISNGKYIMLAVCESPDKAEELFKKHIEA